MGDAFPVVGIGTSAESRETLLQFFSEMPTRAGIAYVVIQQAGSQHRGLVADELKSLSTVVPVDASDGTVIEPDHVYVVPAGEEFAVHEGKLELVGRLKLVRPFDRFLRSLAEERTALARGIVLSGRGDDGAEGLRAIRQQGGLSFALDPSTTRHGGMARHAIASRAVDFVLPLKRMAKQLTAGSPHVEPSQVASRGIAPEGLAQLSARLAELHNRRHTSLLDDRTATQEELRVANEELSAANEELQVLNEELQSSQEQLVETASVLEHKNAALDAANDDLLNVLASVEMPIVIVDMERRVRRWLPGASDLIPLIPRDIGRPITALHPRVDAPLLDEWIAHVIASGQPTDHEVRDRSGRWRRLQIRPYRTRDKQINGALVSLVDIDVLKRAIEDASAARDRAQVLLEAVPLPIVVLEEALSIRSANRAFHDFFGIDPGSTPHRSLVSLSKPREPDALRARLEGAILTGAPVHAFEIACAIGDVTKWISLDARRLVASGGAPLLLVVLQDLTERRLREQAQARAQSERMQRLLNEAGRMLLSESLEARSALEKLARMAVPALGDVCVIDMLGEDESIVPAAVAGRDGDGADVKLEERLDRTAQSTVAQVIRSGQPVLEAALDAAGLNRIGGARAKLLGACDAHSYLCVPLQGRGEVLGALSLARIRSGGGYVAHDVALAEGLGQRAALAIENARLYRSARDAVQLRDEFLGIASHELRTPLTALKLQLESVHRKLSSPGPDADRGRLGDRVENALRYSERLDRLIESLLVVSRIMASHFSLRLEPVDLGEIALDVVKRMQTDAERAGCELDVRVQSGVRGCWDPMRLDQIVSNLLGNAFRYAAGARVGISVEAHDGFAKLIVEDAGPGIARDRLGRIFERYEIGSERSTAGLGLGLYIIRQLAEAHGGSVQVESEVGHGARFCVELPIAGPQPSAQAE